MASRLKHGDHVQQLLNRRSCTLEPQSYHHVSLRNESKRLLENVRMMSEVVGEVSVKRLAFRVVLHDALQRLLVCLILRFTLRIYLHLIHLELKPYFMPLRHFVHLYWNFINRIEKNSDVKALAKKESVSKNFRLGFPKMSKTLHIEMRHS